MSKIAIATTKGKIEVDAIYRNGFFALHRKLNSEDSDDDYIVTHIPTGMKFPMIISSISFGRSIVDFFSVSSSEWNTTDKNSVVSTFVELGKAGKTK